MKPSAIRFVACAKAATIAAAVSLSLAAFADEHADVAALIKAGKHTEAIARAEKAISKSPMDAQMRFTKGLAQTEAGRTADAITTFSRLTEDFPALPEPYNNLAVLYASQGQFEKARATLEAALRTNPSYATAYENLGDVYARLASQAYSSALQLDGSNNSAKPKLALIRDMFAVAPAAPGEAARSRAASGPVSAAPPTAAPASASTSSSTSASVGVAAAAPKPAASRPAAAASIASAPAAPAAAAPSAAAPASNNAEQEVRTAVADWAAAWSSRNVSGYLSAYAGDFSPGKGMTHSAWQAERRARIEGKKHISVQIEQLKVSVHDNTATVQFRQAYRADSLNVTSRKTLEFRRAGQHWVIVKESTGG